MDGLQAMWIMTWGNPLTWIGAAITVATGLLTFWKASSAWRRRNRSRRRFASHLVSRLADTNSRAGWAATCFTELEVEVRRQQRQRRWNRLVGGRATEANQVIHAYADAIQSFLGTIGKSRAIVPSRPFRSPKELEWPRFSPVPLSRARHDDLVHRYQWKKEENLKGQPDGGRFDADRGEAKLIGNLGNARDDVTDLARCGWSTVSGQLTSCADAELRWSKASE
jgi:hypothetical protein